MTIDRKNRKIGIHILGAVTQELIDWLNTWQPNTLLFLGGGAALANLLDSLNYKPAYVVLRMWFGKHRFSVGDRILVVDPNHFDGLAEWALNTNEYGNHKHPETGEILRAEYGHEWNIVWEWGSHQPQRMLLKWLGWVRNDLNAVKGRDNVYVMSFIAGLEGQAVTPAYMAMERERVAVLADHYQLKSVVGNIAAGHYGDDKPLWGWTETQGLQHTMRKYAAAWGFHGYADTSLMKDHGDFQVTDGGDPQSLTPEHPKVYISARKQYEGDMLGAWAAFLFRRAYHLGMAPKGFGDLKIILTEFGWDKPDKDRQPAMAEKYLNSEIPAGFWEYIPHWQRLGFLDKWIGKGRDLAAQIFAGEELAWAERELQFNPEVLGACLYMGRLDGATGPSSWENFNVANTGIFPDQYEAGLARLEGSEPPPEHEPPVAIISGTAPLQVETGTTVTLSSASTGDITGWRWDVFGPGINITEHNAIVTFIVAEPGAVAVTLTVDGPGGTDSATHDLMVVPKAEPPPPGPEPEPSFTLPNLPDWIPFMIGTITGAAIVLVTMAVM